jgi:3-oxoadipate enol-lactonase/4-carboxymuconolactone decarboxylase
MAESGGSAALADAMTPGLIGPGPLEATERARERTRALMAASDADSLARALRAIRRFDARERLGTIDRPALVVAGEHEGNLEDQRRLAAALRHGSLVVMEGAGHMAPMEAPSAFAGIVSEFIERSSKEEA